MIDFKLGNAVSALLDGEVEFLMHCCNCRNNFGSGIAKEIRERIPSAYEADTKHYNANDKILGSMSTDGRVLNLYGQDYFGRKSSLMNDNFSRQLSYVALVESMLEASRYAPKGSTIAVPYLMGSDRAGGKWEIVVTLLEEIFIDHKVIVYKLQ